ncbi:tryptophan--tRNA ligase, partial [Billgrantia desiderata SP1]
MSAASQKTRVLTGITTTGTPHLGNYVGAIKPAIAASQDPSVQSYYFLADLHALIKCQDPQRVQESRLEIAATWLALGLDTDNAIFYRQSDIPEIPELTWMLSCVCAKGLMNRAHAYKAAVAENEAAGNQDPDKGITMGLFGYPVLMAADILMFNAHKVPVGRDQIQHIEMARDIGGRYNHLFKGEYFTLPEAVVDDEVAVLNGLDGRKMSKSYNNTIPLFVSEKKLLKLVRKIKTNSLEPGEPKDPEGCTLFQIYSAFASREEREAMRAEYANGIGWGEVKNRLFEQLDTQLREPRERYQALM